MTRTRKKLAILVSFSGQGGVERMIANLSHALIDEGIDLDILLIKHRGPHVKALPETARLIPLRARHSGTSVFEVARYLRRERPDALLAVKHRGILAAVRARALARTDTPIAGRLGTTVSAALADASSLRRSMWFRAMRKAYPALRSVIAVSQGVADDIHGITGIAQPPLRVIRNPVITDALMRAAEAPVDHPFLPTTSERSEPVIVGAGRLTRQKDFATLLSAFAQVNQTRPARLLILGDGGDRDALLAQAQALGISDRVDLPGFQANPWSWMKRADVFVLSSRWEGSPNSLTEAMALGVPVVSTDCPSGPTELLAGGAVAPLVPMGDVDALAQGILKQLNQPTPTEVLQQAVAEYHARTSARAYMEALGLVAES